MKPFATGMPHSICPSLVPKGVPQALAGIVPAAVTQPIGLTNLTWTRGKYASDVGLGTSGVKLELHDSTITPALEDATVPGRAAPAGLLSDGHPAFVWTTEVDVNGLFSIRVYAPRDNCMYVLASYSDRRGNLVASQQDLLTMAGSLT